MSDATLIHSFVRKQVHFFVYWLYNNVKFTSLNVSDGIISLEGMVKTLWKTCFYISMQYKVFQNVEL